MSEGLINANPIVYKIEAPVTTLTYDFDDEDAQERWFPEEVFEHIRHLNDPEHPLTLEQLNVVSVQNISVDDQHNRIVVYFTPTIPHCSMATLIGLSIRVKLLRTLPFRFKVSVLISPGTHQSELAVNKQLNDKERVAAALENSHLLDVVNGCIKGSDKFL
jgi:metal-sulfur cluster biosynthetic enzyme